MIRLQGLALAPPELPRRGLSAVSWQTAASSGPARRRDRRAGDARRPLDVAPLKKPKPSPRGRRCRTRRRTWSSSPARRKRREEAAAGAAIASPSLFDGRKASDTIV